MYDDVPPNLAIRLSPNGIPDLRGLTARTTLCAMPRFRITRPGLEPTELEADHSSFADAWFTFWGDAEESVPLLLVRRDEGARIEELPGMDRPSTVEPTGEAQPD